MYFPNPNVAMFNRMLAPFACEIVERYKTTDLLFPATIFFPLFMTYHSNEFDGNSRKGRTLFITISGGTKGWRV